MKPYVSPILDSIRKQNTLSLLENAKKYAIDYIYNIDDRNVFPTDQAIENLSFFDKPLEDQPKTPDDILTLLHMYGSPATVAQTGGRYFGFVNGGILPAALGVKWLSDVWDQNAALYVMSPIASKLESIAERWIVDLLGLPEETVAGFVSGSSTATIVGLTTARNYLLKKRGYDVSKQGLNKAPKIKVILSEGAHSTVFKALSIIGLGTENVIKIPMDAQGRINVDQLPEMDDMTLLILQAGNVNTGAFDDFSKILPHANKAGAYVHVDGAFGLWVAANDKFKKLYKGLSMADSWSVDGHKTLNTPYDSGVILCRHKNEMIEAMHMTGAYITLSSERDGMLYTPEMSRRARAIELWATLMSLGKKGVAELVYELHMKARYFASSLSTGGVQILNDIVFNQVLIKLETEEKTRVLLERIQSSGMMWMGSSTWKGEFVIRISVSSYKTTYEDIDLSVNWILSQLSEL